MATNPANLQVTPSNAATVCNELFFRSLWLYDTSRDPNATQTRIVDSKGPMGTTNVNNWAIYDGPWSESVVIAHAQGLHIEAGNWVKSFSLVFENERFNGSTLEVMGISFEDGEWAIVGGTGKFAMATGIIYNTFQEHTNGRPAIELTIQALCPLLEGKRHPVTKIGTWGGNGGSPLDITEASERLENITVCSGSTVNSIEFSYVDYAGEKHTAGPWGGSGGEPQTIKLAESELVTEVSGTMDSFGGNTVITSIKFVTNLQTYGPLGDEKGTPFDVPVQPGSAVVGFFARGGVYLDAIGVYVRPFCLQQDVEDFLTTDDN